MSAHWYGEELRRISEAGMLFTPSQSQMFRERLGPHKADIPVVTGAKAKSPAATL
jgi:hypothetical protein